MNQGSQGNAADVVLSGAGIMSATVGVILKELDPSLVIQVFEVLEDCALESSESWNNAGTGHAANCELNYTPQLADGSVDISKALAVNTEFDLSRQLWAYLVSKGALPSPDQFIHPCPHISFVWGGENVAFLWARHKAMSEHHCYDGMEYSEDRRTISDWAPLIMEGRGDEEPFSATRMRTGTDVEYGALTRLLFKHLEGQPNVAIRYKHKVDSLKRESDGRWRVEAYDGEAGRRVDALARFVFIGAGGGALGLLQESGIAEGRGYGGFPLSGIWLRCDNAEISARHNAKVYGRAAHGSPPMSVPHLDTRIVDGKRSLLFGPYAGFSTKFLKHGSLIDLFRSLRPGNVLPMMEVAEDNVRLMEYLIGQVLQSTQHQFEILETFFPTARRHDWRRAIAGQRVQIIKPESGEGGVLEFGTELVSDSDNTLVALLGASPGASTAAFIAGEVLQRCFSRHLTVDGWLPKLREMIPTWGIDLAQDKEACRQTRSATAAVLKLENI
jgi:malate dehydrogenase (quinone)